MKEVLVFVLGLCVLGLANPQVKDFIPRKYKIDDQETLHREQKVLLLFKNVHQHTSSKHKFNPEKHLHLYSQPQWIEEFSKCNLLEREDIFSVNYQKHLDQAILLFKILYYANDFDTFYKSAEWSRSFVNEAMWLYSVSVALVHRPDTFGLIIPPIYELCPYYFFNSEIISQAQKSKQMYDGEPKHKGMIINDDPLERYTNFDREQLLTYFTEDVSLNSFYYMYHIFYPWWMDGKEFGLIGDRRAEIFYFVLSQLVPRYNAERLSNGLGEVSAIDFNSPLDVGFYPSLTYPNGVAFPSRPHGVNLKESKLGSLSRNSNFTNAYTRLRDFAFRIQNVVDLGRAYSAVEIYEEGNNGIEILSNLLEGNPNSPDLPYYGTLQIYAKNLLGYSPEPLNKDKAIPAATEHYETALRDPATWKFFKWLLNFYDDFYQHLKPYAAEQLQYPGVTIDNVEAEELTTYFDHTGVDLGQSVYYGEHDDAKDHFEVYARQKRLNNRPLVYKITVSSIQEETALFKVFLGPKYDQYGQVLNITENNDKFYAIDYFTHKLKHGKNNIARSISDSASASDRTSYKDLLNKVNKAIRKEAEFLIDGSEAYWAFPRRLLFPKGTKAGMTFQLYVIAIKLPENVKNPPTEVMYQRVGTGTHSGNLTIRYPLDRKIEKSSFFVPNSFVTDMVIRHIEMI